jgi:hypothetical protein
MYCYGAIRIHMIPPRVAIPKEMNPIHTLSSYFFKILMDIICHLNMRFRSGIFPSDFYAKII